MNRFQQRLAVIGMAVSILLPTVHESAGQASTLTAFYTAPVVSMAPMWIAKEVGLFKNQGLDVRVVFIPSGPTGTSAILAGEADVGNIGQGIPALKAGAIDALTTSPPDDLVAQKLGFHVILDITAMKIPFAATVLVSARTTVAHKQPDLMKFMHAYAEAVHYLITNREGASQVIAKYTKVQDREVLNYAVETDTKAVQKTLEVDPKGIELMLALISKTVPQAASAKPADFYDARFFTELRESGFLKQLWGEN